MTLQQNSDIILIVTKIVTSKRLGRPPDVNKEILEVMTNKEKALALINTFATGDTKTAGEQVAFDIFRIDDNGLIAEHWDNLATVSEPNPSGHTQIDGTIEKKKVDAEEARKVVAGLVGDVLRGENPDKLTSYFD